MASDLRLWINAETGRLLSSGSSFTALPPVNFKVGDTVSLELNLVVGAGVAKTPIPAQFPAGSLVKVAIGKPSGIPTAGQWRLSVSSTETADLPFNATPTQVQTALNAISPVSTNGGVTVSALGGGYSIAWNTTGTKPTILAGSDTLVPASYEAIVTLQTGGVSTREIVFVELRQNPVAMASFTTVPTTAISLSTVATYSGKKVWRVKIENPNGGTWLLQTSTSTASFSPGASSSAIKSALPVAILECQSTGPSQWDITTSSTETLSVDGTALIPSYALTGDLSLSTAEAIAYIGTATSAAAYLEVSQELAGKQTTLVQVSCSLSNSVVAPGAIEPIAGGTPLTVEVANATYALLSSFDQGVKTTDSPTFASVNSTGIVNAAGIISSSDSLHVQGSGFDTVLSHDALDFGNVGFSTLTPTSLRLASGGSITFDTGHQLSDADSGGTVTTGGSGTNITSADYPAEIFITVNGTKYAVPARLA